MLSKGISLLKISLLSYTLRFTIHNSKNMDAVELRTGREMAMPEVCAHGGSGACCLASERRAAPAPCSVALRAPSLAAEPGTKEQIRVVESRDRTWEGGSQGLGRGWGRVFTGDGVSMGR